MPRMYPESMRILLDHGANINSLARNMTAPYLAARDNFIEVVKTLLSYQPDLEIECDDTGYTALDVAVVEGHTEVVRLLLEAGADVNHKARFDTFPLQRAKEDTMKALLEYNPIMDLQDGYGDTALHKPSRDTSTPISIIKLLINGGANPEIRNKLGETALFTAVGNSNIEAVEYLISKRAERNISAGKHGGPLHLTCSISHLDLVKILVTRVQMLILLIRTLSKHLCSPLFLEIFT